MKGIIQKLTQFFAPEAPAPSVPPPKPSLLQRVREDHLRCIETQRGIRRQIQELSWKPGSMPEVARLRSERDADGKRLHGNKALKPFRRPETGPDRYRLWDEKRGRKDEARVHNVLYGMLRGRKYAQIERNPADPISSEYLFNVLRCYELNSPFEMIEIGRWILGERDSMREAA